MSLSPPPPSLQLLHKPGRCCRLLIADGLVLPTLGLARNPCRPRLGALLDMLPNGSIHNSRGCSDSFVSKMYTRFSSSRMSVVEPLAQARVGPTVKIVGLSGSASTTAADISKLIIPC